MTRYVVTRFKCARCGKLTVGCKPTGGDGSFRFPSRHEVDGVECPGVYEEAVWVDVDVRTKGTRRRR